MNEELRIRQARPGDVDVIIMILEEAAQLAASKGMPMWPLEFQAEPIAGGIERGEIYLALVGEQAAGTLTLQWSDPVVWGTMAADTGYVHKLAIRRAFAGRQLGLRLLAWAEEAVAAAGRSFLRLDCVATNPVLRDYYERAGFVYRGEAHGIGWQASLYEKQVRGGQPAPGAATAR